MEATLFSEPKPGRFISLTLVVAILSEFDDWNPECQYFGRRRATPYSGGIDLCPHVATEPSLDCCFKRGSFVGIHGEGLGGGITVCCILLVGLTIRFIKTSRPLMVMAALGTTLLIGQSK